MSALTELAQQIQSCRRCELAKTRTRIVPGEGAENADVMFIGEAPGYHEDQQGRPFVGAAGQFLDHLLALIHLQRSQVYIANVIKCRPPGNREPLPVEIQNCRGWLDSQMKAIHPKMIVTLGRHSMSSFFPDKAIGKVHGTAQRQNGVIYFFMYHPAAALHQQSLRQSIEADMLKIPSCLAEVQPVPEVKEVKEVNPQPRQLGLF